MKKDFLNINYLSVSISRGDVKAFQTLYDKMSVGIMKYAYSFVLSYEEAEEIMQDVFLRIWDSRQSLSADKSLSGFIFTITKNLSLDRIRKYSLETEKLKNYFHETPPAAQASVEQRYLYQELSGTIDTIVEGMPTRRKSVYQLSRKKGMSNAEIAEYLSITPTAVEKHIRQALDTIRQELEKRKLSIILILLLIAIC